WSDGDVGAAGDQHVAVAGAGRVGDEVVRARVDDRFDDVLEHFLGENVQPVLRLSAVVAVEDLVERLARELVRRPQERGRGESGERLHHTARDGRLIQRVIREYVNDVRVDQRPVHVLQGRGGHSP